MSELTKKQQQAQKIETLEKELSELKSQFKTLVGDMYNLSMQTENGIVFSKQIVDTLLDLRV